MAYLTAPVVYVFCLKQGGQKNGLFYYGFDLLDELSKRGSKVVLFSTKDYFLQGKKEGLVPDVKFVKLPRISNRAMKWILLSIYCFKIMGKRGGREYIFSSEDLPALLCAWLGRGPIGVVVHDLGEFYVRRYGLMKDFFRRTWIKKLLSKVNYVVCVSSRTKADVERVSPGQKNILTILNSPCRIDGAGKSVKLLYVSGFDYPSKGHSSFISKYADFLKENSIEVHFVGNCGNFKMLGELRALCQSLGVADLISFHVNVTNSFIDLMYRSVDAFVFPSHYEGFGRPLIEAARYGLPIFSNDVGVFRDLQESGYHNIFPLDELECAYGSYAT